MISFVLISPDLGSSEFHGFMTFKRASSTFLRTMSRSHWVRLNGSCDRNSRGSRTKGFVTSSFWPWPKNMSRKIRRQRSKKGHIRGDKPGIFWRCDGTPVFFHDTHRKLYNDIQNIQYLSTVYVEIVRIAQNKFKGLQFMANRPLQWNMGQI